MLEIMCIIMIRIRILSTSDGLCGRLTNLAVSITWKIPWSNYVLSHNFKWYQAQAALAKFQSKLSSIDIPDDKEDDAGEAGGEGEEEEEVRGCVVVFLLLLTTNIINVFVVNIIIINTIIIIIIFIVNIYTIMELNC